MKKAIFFINIVVLIIIIILHTLIKGFAFEKNYNISKNFHTLSVMLENVMPAVVSITIEGNEKSEDKNINFVQPFFNENFAFYKKTLLFLQLPIFQENLIEEDKKDFIALGSGVIINSKKGLIITNNHVIENADKIYIHLADGRKYKAKVIGKDFYSDIALIKIDNIKKFQKTHSIKLANSNVLKVGDYVIAVGSPYGLGETVTSGIVSAVGRNTLNFKNYEEFIQTDAAINRGNSGGPLVNLYGELVGINTAILAPNGGNIGIGFAVPANKVKILIQEFLSKNLLSKKILGIIGIELNSSLSKILKVNYETGIFVNKVIPNSSAFIAGIRPGDLIISIDKRKITDFVLLRSIINNSTFRRNTINIKIIRENQIMFLNINLNEENNIFKLIK